MNHFVSGAFLAVVVFLSCSSPAAAVETSKDEARYAVGTAVGKDGKPVNGGQAGAPAPDLIPPKIPVVKLSNTGPANATVIPQPAVNVQLPRQVLPHVAQNGHHVCDHPYHCKATGFGYMAFTCEASPPPLVWTDCEEVQQFCREETARPEPYEPQLFRQHCFA